MSHQGPDSRTGAGWVFFAAIMMIVLGIFGVFEGLAAIIKLSLIHI